MDLQNLIKGQVVKAVVAKAITALPFLGWPLFNPLVSWLIGKIFDLAYDEIERGVKFIIIDVDAKARADAALKAKDQLQKMLEEYGVDGEGIEDAEKEFDRRYDDLIRFPK